MFKFANQSTENMKMKSTSDQTQTQTILPVTGSPKTAGE